MKQTANLEDIGIRIGDQGMHLRSINNRLCDNKLEDLIGDLGKLSSTTYEKSFKVEKFTELMAGMDNLIIKSKLIKEHMQEDVNLLDEKAAQLIMQANTEDSAECSKRAGGLLTKLCMERNLVTYLSTDFVNEITSIKDNISAAFS